MFSPDYPESPAPTPFEIGLVPHDRIEPSAAGGELTVSVGDQTGAADVWKVQDAVLAALRTRHVAAADVQVRCEADDRMRADNVRWLGHDWTTDVITFPLGGNGSTADPLTGCIEVNPAEAARRAPEQNWPPHEPAGRNPRTDALRRPRGPAPVRPGRRHGRTAGGDAPGGGRRAGRLRGGGSGRALPGPCSLDPRRARLRPRHPPPRTMDPPLLYAALVTGAAAFACGLFTQSLREFTRGRLDELCAARGTPERFGEVLKNREPVLVVSRAASFVLNLACLLLAAGGLGLPLPGASPDSAWARWEPWAGWAAFTAVAVLLFSVLPWALARVAPGELAGPRLAVGGGPDGPGRPRWSPPRTGSTAPCTGWPAGATRTGPTPPCWAGS